MRFKLGKWALAVCSELGETEASFCLQTACEGLILLRDRGRLQHTELPKVTAWSQGKEPGQHPNPRDVCPGGEGGCSAQSDPLPASAGAPLLLLPTRPRPNCSPLCSATSFLRVHSKFAHSVCDARRLYLAERDFLNYWSLQETPPLSHTAPGQLCTNAAGRRTPLTCALNTPLPTARLQG